MTGLEGGRDSGNGGGQRLLRAAGFSLLTVALAAAAHELGGGQVSPAVVAGAGFGVLVLVNPVLGRRRPPAVLVPLMAGLQAGLHLVFMVAAGANAGGPATMPSHGAAHGTATRMPGAAATTGAAGPGWDLGELWSPMTAAHLVAAIVLSLLFLRGEDVLVAVLRRLGLRLPAVPRVPHLLPVRRLVVRAAAPGRPPRPAFARSISRRGPPAGLRRAGLIPG